MGRAPLRFVAAAMAIWMGTACPARAGTLYDDLGGHPGLICITNELGRLNAADPRIRDQFDNVNTERLKRLLVTQFCELSGGPCQYRNLDMVKAHAHLDITMRDFNALVENLQGGMETCGIPFRTQNRLLALLAPMSRHIVTK